MEAEGYGRLIRAAQQGDREAFAALVRRETPRLYRLARRLAGDDATAQDLVQETMLAAWRKLDTFRGEAAFATWLTTILVRRHKNLLRARARRAWWRHLPLLGRAETEGGSEGGRPLDPPDPGPGPEARAAGRQLAARLEVALAALPEGFRQVILLKEVEGMDYATIAATLGIAEGTVKSRVARARAQLRGALSCDEASARAAGQGGGP